MNLISLDDRFELSGVMEINTHQGNLPKERKKNT